ncbi:MAG: Photoactive yellow protein [Pseudomonadota bacterium]|jgi:photoactive yellow protein
MEHFKYNGVDLAMLLPRIPQDQSNGLPFGLVKLDLTGKIIEYNMAEGELTGVDPKWALGKSFFDEVAICTKTAAFYGRFVQGVEKGFLNTVFDYVFDHRAEGVRVKVHMVMVPDHLGRKVVLLMVKRMDKPAVQNAVKPAAPQATAAALAAPAPAAFDLSPAADLLSSASPEQVAKFQAALEQLAASVRAMPVAPVPVAPAPPPPAPARPPVTTTTTGHVDIFQL